MCISKRRKTPKKEKACIFLRKPDSHLQKRITQPAGNCRTVFCKHIIQTPLFQQLIRGDPAVTLLCTHPLCSRSICRSTQSMCCWTCSAQTWPGHKWEANPPPDQHFPSCLVWAWEGTPKNSDVVNVTDMLWIKHARGTAPLPLCK